MSRISTTGITASSGLVSGIPIQDTVDQLIALSAIPRDQLAQRTSLLQSERSAVDTLSSFVLSLSSSLSSLNLSEAFAGRSASSSDSDAVSVSVQSDTTPAIGAYQFTPLRSASANQYVSASIDDPTAALGSGVLAIGVGGHLDQGVALTEINGGTGFNPGEVRITDAAGQTATIDLRAATTVDDILREINNNDDIDVVASTDGDQFVLTDESGGAGTLQIEDLGGGAAAESLGLADVDAVGGVITGSDIYGLAENTRLSTLNNGLGVGIDDTEVIDDLEFTVADGTEGLGVDLTGAATVGDILDAINNDADLDGKITATISSDGDRIVLTDNTTGSGEFTVQNGLLSTTADDLGLTADTDGDATLTGSRLISGLQDTLLTSLNGGAGIDTTGLTITDRNGASASIDLSSAETLNELIDAINSESAIDVTARISDNRGGLVIEANSGSGNLVIAENGGATAADLGIVIDDAVDSVDSGFLGRATVGRTTSLSDFNSGGGVSLGSILITDSSGVSAEIDLEFSGEDDPTIGDVIDEINDASIGVTASINAAGDGILLTDTAGGADSLSVAEVDDGSTAADLRLLGVSSETDSDGQQTIDGTTRFEIDLSEIDAAGLDTPIGSLRSGEGIDQGVLRIYDSTYDEDDPDAGGVATINLTDAGSLGDIIDRINETTDASVTAALNEDGTGIVITDTAGGSGDLVIEDVGSGTAAADLGIDGTFEDGEADGDAVLSSAGGLELLAARINDSQAGFTAAVIYDGFGYRLSVNANEAGSSTQLLIESDSTSLAFSEISRGADAVALFGSVDSGGFTVTSQDGTYNDLIPGLDITVSQATGETVTLNVVNDDAALIDSVETFISAYNSLQSFIDDVTAFDEEGLSTGILFGRSEVLQVETGLARIISGSFTSGSLFTSLESVGVSLEDDGTLSLDQSKLRDALAEDRNAVESLFQDEEIGVVTQIEEIAERLAGTDGLLDNRSDALDNTIDTNNQRISDLDLQLERERERLLLQFIALEETIAQLSANTDLLDSIQPITIAGATSGA